MLFSPPPHQQQKQSTITTSSTSNSSSSSGYHFPAGVDAAAGRVRPGSVFDLVYDEDGSFSQGFGPVTPGLKVQFLRIHGIAFTTSGSVFGLQNPISEEHGSTEKKRKRTKVNNKNKKETGSQENDTDDQDGKLIGLKFELFGCYMEPLMINDDSGGCVRQNEVTFNSQTLEQEVVNKSADKQGLGGGQTSSVRGGRDSAVREYSVNSGSNIVLLCEVTSDFRYAHITRDKTLNH